MADGWIGRPVARIDGRAKVTGTAVYPSDESVPNPAHAFLVTSVIARGRVRGFHLDAARAVPGVLDILTHENVGQEAGIPPQAIGGGTTTTLQSARIWHDGQIVAIVVAETFAAAREAAQKLEVEYEAETPAATFGSPGVSEEVREPGEHEDFAVGDAATAFAAAAVKVDARYGTPTQHHNAIELFTTTCEWSDGRLTIYEPSQFVYGLRGALAKQLKLDPDRIRVVSRFVGGAFGSKGGATARTAWIAIAARRLGRPVKLVATRDQGYTIATYRAETRHHVQLGATREGRLVSLRHEGWELTSRPSKYNVSGTETTARVYACPNILTKVNVVHADRNTPGFMRAPPDTPYMFALECAMDELAAALGIDPVELRRRNDTETDPVSGRRFSSRSLMACFDQAAARFGWKDRDARPRSMADGDWLVGYGCATAAYPANIGAAAVRLTLRPDGEVFVAVAAHDLGTGTYTVAAMTAADRLGIEMEKVHVELGDTALPPANLSAGSSHAAAVCNAVAHACAALRERLIQAAITSNDGPLAGADPAAIVLAAGALRGPNGHAEPLERAVRRAAPNGELQVCVENVPKGVPPAAMQKLYQGQMILSRGSNREDVTAYGFGAQFVEVRIHRRTCEVRVPRAVGAFACGTILNPRTAHSQLMSGMIWGIGAALHEVTEIDKATARYVNDNLAEYLIPVNADIPSIDVILVPEHDREVNPLGIKGVGEIGIVGMNAAVANAVYHATGIRFRDLPIRIDDVLRGEGTGGACAP